MRILAVFFLLISFAALSVEVKRDEKGLPICFKDETTRGSIHLYWSEDFLTRELYYINSFGSCEENITSPIYINKSWNKLNEEDFKKNIPLSLQKELLQIKNKATELREDLGAKEFVERNKIETYTLELNRSLSEKYGQIFSSSVFKEIIEKDLRNKNFRKKIRNNFISAKQQWVENKFSSLKNDVVIVVSFGLGWDERYNKTTPYYLKDFIYDLKSLGLPVTFLKRNPFGTIKENVEAIVPQLEDILTSEKEIVFISLCKGTPELLAAEAIINQEGHIQKKGKILGHVNLSGMLGGSFFSDYSREVVFPKIIAPLMKIIPAEIANDSARMIDVIDYMKSSTIENVLSFSTPFLDKERLYINVTGSPLTTQVLDHGSPMIPVLKYNLKKKLITGASDGFLELPKTLIPSTISKNQLTLVLDSSHLLSDGVFDEFRLDDKINRRMLYNSILDEIFEYNNINI